MNKGRKTGRTGKRTIVKSKYRIPLTVSKQMYDEIERLADENGIYSTEVVRQCIKYALNIKENKQIKFS